MGVPLSFAALSTSGSIQVMHVNWEITEDDVRLVRSIVHQQKDNPFVLARAERNLATTKPPVRKATFWQSLVGCLLTTQQRSGPRSAVSLFIRARPFPLSYAVCCKKRNLQTFATQVISRFGGIRRGQTAGPGDRREFPEWGRRLRSPHIFP